MASNFRIIYLYIVSLITLIMIVGGIVFTVNNITSYFFPDSYVFFREKTVNEYAYNYEYDYEYDYDYDIADEKEAEIEKINYRNEKIKDSIVSLVVVTVGGIMYKYHWSIIGKERME